MCTSFNLSQLCIYVSAIWFGLKYIIQLMAWSRSVPDHCLLCFNSQEQYTKWPLGRARGLFSNPLILFFQDTHTIKWKLIICEKLAKIIDNGFRYSSPVSMTESPGLWAMRRGWKRYLCSTVKGTSSSNRADMRTPQWNIKKPLCVSRMCRQR